MSRLGSGTGFSSVRKPLTSRCRTMKRLNALPPVQMTPAARRAELCELLALGLIRLRMRERAEVSDQTGESCLHCPPDQCLHATPTYRRDA